MGLQDQSLECCAWLHAVGACERRFAWSLHLESHSLSTQKQCSQFARDSDSSVLLPGRAPRVQTLLWQIFFQKQKFSNKLDCGEVRSTVRFSIVPYCLWSLYSTSLASTHCGSAAIDGWIRNDSVVYVCSSRENQWPVTGCRFCSSQFGLRCVWSSFYGRFWSGEGWHETYEAELMISYSSWPLLLVTLAADSWVIRPLSFAIALLDQTAI